MTQPAKAQEPSMEEILASIRRIIADDEAKPAASVAAPAPREKNEAVAASPKPAPIATPMPPPMPPKPAPAPAAPEIRAANATNSQDDIDSMLAGLDAVTSETEVRPSDSDLFELTDDMAVKESAFQRIDPQDDVEFTEAAPAARPMAPPAYEAPEPRAAAEQSAPTMLSRNTVSAVESAFNSLAHTVLSNNARTLEDLVREMLRPMLKSWLDDNLPGLVERIVRAEIERVSRGR